MVDALTERSDREPVVQRRPDPTRTESGAIEGVFDLGLGVLMLGVRV